MASSSIPTVKGALKTALAARAGLSGVTIDWAYPGPDKMQREHIFYGQTKINQTGAAMGNGTRHESYTQDVWFCVKKEGNIAQTVEARAYAMVAELEAELHTPSTADLGLGPSDGIKSLTVQVGDIEPETYSADQGYSTEIRVSLNVDARI